MASPPCQGMSVAGKKSKYGANAQ
ncbi:hypothetical protein [Algoriphagus boritolerans]